MNIQRGKAVVRRLWLAGVLLLGLLPRADSQAEECFQDKPLLSVELESMLLDITPQVSGEWRLPLSAQNPRMTEARIRVGVSRNADGGAWQAQVDFSFPDPKPYGIPFSFQGIQISWMTAQGAHSVMLDWSANCTSVGRSLYPGQKWSTTFDLPDTRDNWFLDRPVVRLWGSRN